MHSSKIYISSATLFISGYYLYMLSNILLESNVIYINSMSTILRILKYAGLLLILITCTLKHNINKKIGIAIFILFTLFLLNSFAFSGGSGLIEIGIIITCFVISGLDIGLMFKATINSLIIGHLFVVMLTVVGVLDDKVTTRYIGNNYMGTFFSGMYYRHNLGFLVHNQIPLTLMLVYLYFIAYKKENISLAFNIFIFILNYIVFHYFGSRVSFLIVLVCIFFYYIVKVLIKYHNMLFSRVGWISYVLCCFLSLTASKLYNPNNSTWYKINEIFYNRLRFGNTVLNKYGISLFGYGLTLGSSSASLSNIVIDNGYLLIYLQRGLLIATIVIALWSYLTFKAGKKGDLYLVLVLTMLAVANLIDTHLISYKMIPFYCLMIAYFKQSLMIRNSNNIK